MKLNSKLITGLAIAGAAALIVKAAKNHRRSRMLNQVSDEGYETAHDVLFPQKSPVRRNLRLGPVLPA